MKTALGIMKDGGWQKYVVVPATLCFVLPPKMLLEDSIFCQPLSNCIRGWDNMDHVNLDARILVAGAGINNFYI
jgi:Threonine dehydrogenase and related Zn-dependent dehydrogenases